MRNDRKRVAIHSEKTAFNRALRLLLDGYDVVLIKDLSLASDEYDALVVQADGQLNDKAVADASLLAPTLVVANREEMIDAVDAGCRGFLPATSSLEEIRDGVNTIVAGGAVVPPDLLGVLLRHVVERRRLDATLAAQLDDLTDRERQVFHLAARGARKEEIGERLFISPATARTHLQRVYRKLGIHSQSELIALAVRMGELGPDET